MHTSENYQQRQNLKNSLNIRLKGQKQKRQVEYFDGIRINPESIPEDSHMYHTRHSDRDITQPVTILPEHQTVVVNFCGTVVTDRPLDISEETKLMYVSWV